MMAEKTTMPFCIQRQLPHELVSPPSEFSQAPFWFWNDELTESELAKQMKDFQEHGIHSFVIHPRAGLPRSIGRLSDRMLHFIRFAVEGGHELRQPDP